MDQTLVGRILREAWIDVVVQVGMLSLTQAKDISIPNQHNHALLEQTNAPNYLSNEKITKNSCFPLYWLINMDPYNGLL